MSAVVLVAIGLTAASGIVGAVFARGSIAGERLCAALMVAGAALGGGAAVRVLWHGGAWFTTRFTTAWDVPGGAFDVRVDALSAMFLLQIFVVAALGALYALAYWPQRDHPDDGRKLRCFYGLMTAGMALLVVAHNTVLFLVGWEIMAISGFFCVSAEDAKEAVRQSGYVYLTATRLGTLLLLAMFAVLHAATGSWSFDAPTSALPPATAGAVAALALGGFGLKAGLMPLHVWLPGAHANAPSHVSAVMSGVLIKMGVYGLVRVASLFADPPMAWGVVTLLVGTTSAVLGVAFAIGQHDLKRLLAYHSVENVGIIVMGLGVALIGRAAKEPVLVALGLSGALLHVWNHGLFKALLFLTAGSVLHATGTREIDELGGLARRMPWTTLAFVVGAVAICGLPPLNGFVSEIFVYLGLLRAVSSDRLWLAGALGAPALALVGALALACFVKVLGAALLGQPRTERARTAREAPAMMLAPMLLLALLCAAIGLAPTAIAWPVDRAAAAWNAGAPLPPLTTVAPLRALSVTGASLAILAGVLATWLARRTRGATAAETWGCGYASPSARMQYTASSFAAMLVGMFSWALRPESRADGVDGFFPRTGAFRSHVPDTVLDRAVLPLSRWGARALGWFRWVQRGSAQLYLLYVLAALVVLLLFFAKR